MKKLLALMIGAVLILCFAGTASALPFSHKQQTKSGQFFNHNGHVITWNRLAAAIQPLKFNTGGSNVGGNSGISTDSNRRQNGWEGGFREWTPGDLAEIVVSPPFRNPFFAGLFGIWITFGIK